MKLLSISKVLVLVLSLLLLQQNFVSANEAVLRKVLNNGLTVLAKESSPKDLVTIAVTVKAAPKYESKYLGSGISHLVEHMLFKGTALRKPADIDRQVRSFGGIIGGAVSSDFTNYQITVPVKYFSPALALLKDMLLNASFDKAEMEKEREVILKEMRLNNDDPEKKSILSLFFNSYIRHPYRYPLIGYEDLLMALTREDLLEYYKSRYVPNNIIITVVGGIAEKEALSQVEKEFSSFRKSDYGSFVARQQEPPQLGRKSVEEEAPVTLAYIAMGFHSTGILDRDLFAMDILSMILGRGDDSRFSRALIDQKRLAHSINASNYTPEESGLFIVSAVTDADKAEACRNGILEEIKRISTEDVSGEELEAAKRTLLSGYIMSRETMEEDAKDLSENETLTGNYDFSSRYLEGIGKVTRSDIKRVAMRYLTKENMTDVTLLPKSNRTLSAVNVPKPAVEDMIQKKTLPNGIVVLSRRNSKIPAVSITVAFSGGLAVEDKDNNGISYLTSKMMLDGTKTRKESDIISSIEKRGGSIEPFSGFNSFGLNINVLKEDLGQALELLKDVITDSVFPTEEVGKEKVLAIAFIKQDDNDIFQKGAQRVKKLLFKDHPYGMRYSGEMETISRMKKEDLMIFYHNYCVPNNMVISISGDINPEEVSNKIEALFKDIPRADLPKRPVSESAAGTINKELLNMDKEQALLMVAFKTVGVNDPDRYPLDVLETLMSGMSGRLFDSIREKSGLSYTLGCVQRLGKDTGLMLFYAATTKDNINFARDKLFAEINMIRDKIAAEDELDGAKRELISGYKMAMQTNSSYTFQSALDELFGPGYDNLYKYEENIKKVTKEDVKRVADKYLDLKAYAEVVVEPE